VAVKHYVVATVKRNWGTWHMSLTEIQLKVGLDHVSSGTVFDTLCTREIKADVEKCKFVFNEYNKKQRVVSGTSLPRPSQVKFMLMVYRSGAIEKKNGVLMASAKM
jgi:hypothetical protein